MGKGMLGDEKGNGKEDGKGDIGGGRWMLRMDGG